MQNADAKRKTIEKQRGDEKQRSDKREREKLTCPTRDFVAFHESAKQRNKNSTIDQGNLGGMGDALLLFFERREQGRILHGGKRGPAEEWNRQQRERWRDLLVVFRPITEQNQTKKEGRNQSLGGT
jgi:hypothetical protein